VKGRSLKEVFIFVYRTTINKISKPDLEGIRGQRSNMEDSGSLRRSFLLGSPRRSPYRVDLSLLGF